MSLTLSSTLPLRTGHEIPLLGFGTWKLAEGDEAVQAVLAALELGYRHIDGAAIYGNEASVGEAIERSGVRRSEIFLTTKCWNDDIRGGFDVVIDACHRSLELLRTDYLDLYLLHWPIMAAHHDAWGAFERLHHDGLIRTIGVSNYLPHHLADLLDAADIPPAVNQIEFHPLLQQRAAVEANEQNGIVTEAWSPLIRGKAGEIPAICEIADAHNKTPAQVVLRWEIQQGVVTIPKSSRRSRIAENADIFDFQLTPDEMAAISALDRGERTGPDPDNIDF